MVAIGDCMRRSQMRRMPSNDADRKVDSDWGGRSAAEEASAVPGLLESVAEEVVAGGVWGCEEGPGWVGRVPFMTVSVVVSAVS